VGLASPVYLGTPSHHTPDVIYQIASEPLNREDKQGNRGTTATATAQIIQGYSKPSFPLISS
jgi:hypothetical protein